MKLSMGAKSFFMFIGFAFVMSVYFLLSGCAYLGMTPPPSVCDTAPGDSVICRVCGELDINVEVADLILQAAALRSLDDHDKAVVVSFYDGVEAFLLAGGSYTALINYVQDTVELTGPELMIISLYLPRFVSPQVITAFDQELLLAHIEGMRAQLE